MEDYYCTNYSSCQLLNSNQVTADNQLKIKFDKEFCSNPNMEWKNCKRYITRHALNFCPDFVLPDTLLTPGEILNEYDNQMNYSNINR